MNPESGTDAELVGLAAEGDEGAFACLLERHYDTIFRTAFKWCGQREQAEDIAQEVCVKLARVLHTFDSRARFGTWLYRVTINTAKDLRRKGRRYVSLEDVGSASVDEMRSDAAVEHLVDFSRFFEILDGLPTKLRETIVLVYLEDLSHKEAAVVLGCAETTVSWRIFQARRKLRSLWSDPGDE